MTCEERRDLMLLYVTGATDPAETQELRAHLASGCPRCAASLAEAEATVSQLPLALDPQQPSPNTRERLMKRVATQKAVAPITPKSQSAQLLQIFGYIVAACIGLALGIYGWRSNPGAPGAPDARVAELEHRLSLQNLELTILRGAINARSVEVVSLQKQDTQPKATGRVYWDKDHNQWHVVVFDMVAPPTGELYELWFITPDQKKVAAGALNVDANGYGTTAITVPANIGPIALAAITNEKMGKEIIQPEGKIQLVGTVPQ